MLLSRALSSLQSVINTAEQADLRADLEFALALLEEVQDALEPQLEDIPF